MKRLLRLLILAIVRVLGVPGAYMATRSAQRHLSANPRILLIRPDHLGDLVLTTPILHALQQHLPAAQITMMVGPWSKEVVARHPAINQLMSCPFPGFQRAPQGPLEPYKLLLRTAQQLRRENYAMAINLRPDFWWGAALIYLAAIPRRIGYAIEPGTPFLTHALPFPAHEHASISNLRLISASLQALGYEPLDELYTPERYPLQFTPTPAEQQWASEHLQAEGLSPEQPIVVIHAGTGGEVKLWRPEAWATCANRLASLPQFSTAPQLVLTGSQQERPMLEEIARKLDAPALLLTNTTVGQLAALLQRAQLVLGVDNGPLHLAVAQGVPTVNLFGPTDTRIFGPWGPAARHIAIASKQRCQGCATIPCGRLDFTAEEVAQHPCVRSISEQQVLQAIANLATQPMPKQVS